jgi:hypothetical protein
VLGVLTYCSPGLRVLVRAPTGPRRTRPFYGS